MKTLTFTLVKTDVKNKQRYYSISQPLSKGRIRSMESDFKWDPDFVKTILLPEAHVCIKDEGFLFVCISDAKDHFERLAFPAFIAPNLELVLFPISIEGFITPKLIGGLPSLCWEDELYLRLIARHNGFSQNNVQIISPVENTV